MPQILVTQSFGKESEFRRVILAILSAFVYWKGDKSELQVVLFTDNPSFFSKWLKGLKVHFVTLSPKKIKSMRGEIDFLHRMKIALIEESFALFPNSDMFYFDSDTFFIDNSIKGFQRISEQQSSMHLHEYQFDSIKDMPLPAGETFQAFYKLILSNDFQLSNGERLKVLPTDSSWNAGVMCLHHTHARFLKDVYTLTDQFYPSTKNHASEQYAFSIMLQKNTNLVPCEELVYHYWYRIKKQIIDLELEKEDFVKIENLELDQKLVKIKAYTYSLPVIFENHYLTLNDNAFQSFHENIFIKGYFWYFRSFMKSPKEAISKIKDVLYHTKRMILGRK